MLTLSALLLTFPCPGWAVPQTMPCLAAWGVEITGRVYFGNASGFDPDKGETIGTVRSKDVYLEIPAYRQIAEEGVERGSARWTQLMKEATASFKRAIKAAAKESTAVLVVEEGGVSGYPVVDITGAVIGSI